MWIGGGGEGSNLKEKIASLKSKIIISRELLEAMDELRILGNDVAHVEAKEYENISKEKTTVAIECAKEPLNLCVSMSLFFKK